MPLLLRHGHVTPEQTKGLVQLDQVLGRQYIVIKNVLFFYESICVIKNI